ncbi:hypothetical protein CANARDRAFT_81292 [[Candida] arabinofermentans NRRL YB-2248]|uniref:Uncharacterized protein n=1 Tax=[Candida] arabinofermentans NRRL YB-2248 TaxID=983967 RepID=A0A1E4SV99_9ASCO|nr:hypothetical protein CANARDRAFT_81292 [[Candida] arabinofermentans NRRL YB-2248]
MSLEYPVRLMIGKGPDVETGIGDEFETEVDVFEDAREDQDIHMEDANLLVDRSKYNLPTDFAEVLKSPEKD